MSIEKSEQKKDNYNFIDLRGKDFGKLHVLENEEYIIKKGKVYFLCQCNCGSEPKYYRSERLRNGHFSNCGCIRKKAQGVGHGLSKTKIYSTYNNIKKRCYNPNSKDYIHYGGRGITICDEWLDENGFVNFYNWAIENGYNDTLTIDRKEVNGNYEPDNCRWVSLKIQENNRTNNRMITIEEITKNITQWAEEYGLSSGTIRSRLKRGKLGRDLIKPVKNNNSNIKGVI